MPEDAGTKDPFIFQPLFLFFSLPIFFGWLNKMESVLDKISLSKNSVFFFFVDFLFFLSFVLFFHSFVLS